VQTFLSEAIKTDTLLFEGTLTRLMKLKLLNIQMLDWVILWRW